MAKKEKQIERAQKFVQKGYFDKAIAEYKSIVKADPSDISLRLRLGELYVKTGLKEEAIKEYSSIGKYNTTKGFYLKAIAVYKQVIKLDETNLEIHNKLADLYTKQRLIADAIGEYSYILNTYEKKGYSNEAFDLLKKMVGIDEENAGLKLRLADTQKKLGYEDDALDLYCWIFQKFMSKGKTEKAENLLRDLYADYPKDMRVLEGLVGIKKESGDVPQFVSHAVELIDSYKEGGELEKIEELCESILEVSPDNEKAKSMLDGLRGEVASGHEDSADEVEVEEAHVDEVLEDGETEPAAPEQGEALQETPEQEVAEVEDPEPEVEPEVEQETSVEETEEEPESEQGTSVEEAEEDVEIDIEMDIGTDTGEEPQESEELFEVDFDDDDSDVDGVDVEDEESPEDEPAAQDDEPASQELPTGASSDEDTLPEAAAEAGGDDDLPDEAPEEIEAVEAAEDIAEEVEEDVALEEELSEPEPEPESEQGEEGPLHASLDEAEESLPEESLPEELSEDAVVDEDPSASAFEVSQDEAEDIEIEEIEDVAILEQEDEGGQEAAIVDEGIEELVVEDADELKADETALDGEDDISELSSETAVEEISDDHSSLEEVEIEEVLDEDGSIEELSPEDMEEVEVEVPPSQSDTEDVGGAATTATQPEQELSEEEVALSGDYTEETLAEDNVKAGQTQEGDGLVDLTEELDIEEALGQLVDSWSDGESDGGMVEEFKAGMGEQLSREDVETHFNLGIAYMEMELFEDAVREFKLSAKDPVFEFNSYARLGQCSVAMEKATDAVGFYIKGLAVKGMSDTERIGAMYELALAYSQAGQDSEALQMMTAVGNLDPEYREVAEKLVELSTERNYIPVNDNLIEVELL